MVRKKSSSTKNQSLKNKDVAPRSETGLEDKIIYAMANTSVILMSTMMGAFTQVIGSTMGAMASGMHKLWVEKKPQTKLTKKLNRDSLILTRK